MNYEKHLKNIIIRDFLREFVLLLIELETESVRGRQRFLYEMKA